MTSRCFASLRRSASVLHRAGYASGSLAPRFLPTGYQRLCAHYAWALSQVFAVGYEAVIILEEDLEVSSDFFSYFEARRRRISTQQAHVSAKIRGVEFHNNAPHSHIYEK